jgi:hypothetical protein
MRLLRGGECSYMLVFTYVDVHVSKTKLGAGQYSFSSGMREESLGFAIS